MNHDQGLFGTLFSAETWVLNAVVSRGVYIRFLILSVVVTVLGVIGSVIGAMLLGFVEPGIAGNLLVIGGLNVMWFVYLFAAYLGASMSFGRIRDIFGCDILDRPGVILVSIATFVPYVNILNLILFCTQPGVLTEGIPIKKSSMVNKLYNLGSDMGGWVKDTWDFSESHSPSTKPKREKEADKTPDLADQIRRLGDLNKEGLLTDDEFRIAKARLLGADVKATEVKTAAVAVGTVATPPPTPTKVKKGPELSEVMTFSSEQEADRLRNRLVGLGVTPELKTDYTNAAGEMVKVGVFVTPDKLQLAKIALE